MEKISKRRFVSLSVSVNRSELISEIRAGMAKKNMTQAELALELEVSESTLSAKMQEKSCFTIQQARRLRTYSSFVIVDHLD